MQHPVATLVLVLFAAMPALSHAQSGGMKGMDMRGDMKGMEMKDMEHKGIARQHVAKGTVKSVDAKAGRVTLDHEPVNSMKWPAMTMTFTVKDKALIDKLPAGKKVEVEFEQRGKDYVITSVK